jgi:heme exporter protein D
MIEFQFSGLSEFLTMGGNGLYVWPSYGLFLLFIMVNISSPLLSKRKILAMLKARQAREHRQRATIELNKTTIV